MSSRFLDVSEGVRVGESRGKCLGYIPQTTERKRKLGHCTREAWRQLAVRNNEIFPTENFQDHEGAFSSQAEAASSFNCANSYVRARGKLAS